MDAKSTNRLMEETRFYKLAQRLCPARRNFGAEEVTARPVTAGQVTTVTESQKFRKFVNDERRPCPPSNAPSRTCSPARNT